MIVFIVFMERAQRRLLIRYPKRQVGNRMFEGRIRHSCRSSSTRRRHPADLRLFAASAADHHRQFSQAGDGTGVLATLSAYLAPRPPGLHVLYVGLIVFFAFFYTAIVFNPDETADNLKKHGGFVPGIRPGERTAEYIDHVLTRITVIGAAYLAPSALYRRC